MKQEKKTTIRSAKLTGGIAGVPVSALYCRNTSRGRGPRMINRSIIPLSDIQWVSV